MSTEHQNVELPEGWAEPTVKNVVELKYGKGLKKSVRSGGRIPVYGSNGVVGHHDVALTKGETIVVGRKGTVGAINLSAVACWPIDTTYFVDDFGELNSIFLFHALSSLGLEELDTSTAIPGLNRDDAYAQRIPFPPNAEQKRIVAQVESLLAKVNAARERLAGVPAILRRFRQSVLAAACSGQLTADWRDEQVALETTTELIGRIAAERREKYSRACIEANAAGRRKPSDFDNYAPRLRDDLELFGLPEQWQWVDFRFVMDEQRPFCYGVVQPGENDPNGNHLVRAGDLDNGTVDVSGLRRIPANVDEHYKRSRLDGGEILITVVGANIGTVAIAPQSCGGFNVARAVAKVPVRDFDSRYLLYWLMTSTALAWLKNDAREVARPTLNLEQLRTLPIPLPPLAEQKEIVFRVSKLLERSGAIQRRLDAAQRLSQLLPQAVLQKAFRGELVPTEAELARAEGRDYEPANVLLERIRVQQGSEPSSNGAPRRRKSGRKPVSTKPEQLGDEIDGNEKPVAAENNGAVRRIKSAASAPAALADYTTDDLMAEFRAALWGAGEITEAELLRAVARRLGYDRLGQNVRAELEGHLRAAIRRQIVARDGDCVTCPTSIFRNYDADFLRARFKSIMALSRKYTRDDVLVNLATYLGFRNVTDAMREHMKPIFTSAIRRGDLAYRGKWIWREG